MSSKQETDEGSFGWGLLIMFIMMAIGATGTLTFFGGGWWWPVLLFVGLVAVSIYRGRVDAKRNNERL